MGVFLIFASALKALRRNHLRTALTMIGIAAVICAMALGTGSAARIHEDLLNLGDNFVWVENGSRNVARVKTGTGGVPRVTSDDMPTPRTPHSRHRRYRAEDSGFLRQITPRCSP